MTTKPKPNLQLKNCALCGAPALLWNENTEDGSISADYECECVRLHEREYTDAYTRDYYIRQKYLRFMASLEEKDKRYFSAAPRLTAGNEEALTAALDFAPPKFVYLYGDPGIGKTHISIIAARSCILAGKSVRFVSESQIVDERRAATFREGPMEKLPQALILDDLGKKGKPGDFYASLIHDLLEECDRKDVALFVTSNHSPEEAARRIASDEQNGAAIESRLRLGKVIHMKDKSQREGSKA